MGILMKNMNQQNRNIKEEIIGILNKQNINKRKIENKYEEV